MVVMAVVVLAVVVTVSDKFLSYSLDLALKSGDRDLTDGIGSVCIFVSSVGATLFRNAVGSGCG